MFAQYIGTYIGSSMLCVIIFSDMVKYYGEVFLCWDGAFQQIGLDQDDRAGLTFAFAIHVVL